MPLEQTLDAIEVDLLPSNWTLDATKVNFRFPLSGF
jgi:hypothetical protein